VVKITDLGNPTSIFSSSVIVCPSHKLFVQDTYCTRGEDNRPG
jgi:hypothetical protein